LICLLCLELMQFQCIMFWDVISCSRMSLHLCEMLIIQLLAPCIVSNMNQRVQFLLVTTTSAISAFTRHRVSGHTCTFVCRVVHWLLQRIPGGCAESDDQQTATSVERCSPCGQRYQQVRPRFVVTPPYRATFAGCSWASRVQTWLHAVQLPSCSSASIPRGIVPTSRRCRITATSLIRHPTAPSRTTPPA